MVSKHIWIIPFEAWTKKHHFGGTGPAGTDQASSQQVPKMHDLIAPLRSSSRADRKTYMICLVWSLDELIIIFERFYAPDCSRTGQAGLETSQAALPAPVGAQAP